MLIGTSKYNYYHIRANGAQKLSACIYNFSGWIYMTKHQQLPSCQIITLYTTRTLSSVIGHQLASGHPVESWQPTTLSLYTFYGQNTQFTLSEAGVNCEDRWPPHLQTQHPLQNTKNSWKLTWSARRGIHMWPTCKSHVAQTCRQQTKHSKCFTTNIWTRDIL